MNRYNLIKIKTCFLCCRVVYLDHLHTTSFKVVLKTQQRFLDEDHKDNKKDLFKILFAIPMNSPDIGENLIPQLVLVID